MRSPSLGLRGGADEADPYRQATRRVVEVIVVAWILLIVAGLCEVAWAGLLPSTNGLTRPLPTAGFVVMLAASMFLLARAAQDIPLGTAYGVWVGIGAVGAAIVGMAFHDDPATPARLAFLGLLVVSVAGLKLTGGT